MTFWKTYTAAPHRVMFLGGMLQLLLAVGAWGVELAQRYGGGESQVTAVYATWAHAWLMFLGLFPFFMFGFLMTTYPRWMMDMPVPRRDYVGAFLLQFGGVLLFYGGLHGRAGMVAAGVLLHLFGMGWAVFALFRVYWRAGPERTRRYESHLNVALCFGLAADASWLAWLVTGDGRLLMVALSGGLWLFLVPMLVLVAHRMIPFFSGSALPGYTQVQPGWSFPLVWYSVALHFALEVFGARGWLWLADGPLLFMTVHHSLHWQFRRALAVPLLGALHIAFACLSLGLVLSMTQSLWLLATGEVILWRAPLHAIGIGFIGGMTVAMVTRVSRGHSGRPIEMGPVDIFAFGAVLIGATVRIAAEIAPMGGWSPLPLSVAAALIWVVGLSPWAMRYLPIYWRPRADGKAD